VISPAPSEWQSTVTDTSKRFAHRPLRRFVIGVVAASSFVGTVVSLPASQARAELAIPAVLKFAQPTVTDPSGVNEVTWDCRCTEPVELREYDTDSVTNAKVIRVRGEISAFQGTTLIGGFRPKHRYEYRLVLKSTGKTIQKAGPIDVKGLWITPTKDLLEDLSTDVHGLSIDAKVLTSRPSSIYVMVGTEAPVAGANGLAFPAGSTVATSLSSATTNAAVSLFGLAPKTEYFVLFRAIDANLSYQDIVERVVTKARRVTLTFTELYIDDDSDNLSDCDCSYRAWVSGIELFSGYTSAGSNAIAPLNMSKDYDGYQTSDPIHLRFEAYDDDNDVYDANVVGCPVYGPPPIDLPPAGEHELIGVDCTGDTEGAQVVALANVIPTLGGKEKFDDTIYLGTYSFALKYNVTVKVSVSYI
jgi:hypothetical protein